jgi:hypothetical protein
MTAPSTSPNDRADAALAHWLAAARSDLAARTPPSWLHSELQARLAEHEALRELRATRAVPAQAPARSPWRWLAWLAVPAMAACALLLATAVALQSPARPGGGAVPEGAPFIALASMEAIAAEPEKVVVAAELPRAALAHYGLPFDPSRADQPARAELLLSARGAVLAVRFMQ